MRILIALVTVAGLGLAAYSLASEEEVEATSEVGSVTLVGDSLNVGMEPYLREELAGWDVSAHDLVGRGTREGIGELRRLRGRLAPIVVVSLGTNDPDGSEAEFRGLVAHAIELAGARRCLLWATIVRGGAPRTAFNSVLADAADEHQNVRLVDWAALVASDEELLEADAIHGTPAGYARRAEETARTARDCPRG